METRSKKRKRQRLMASSYVSSRQRPDLPARFESLNDDTLTTTLQFVGDKSYRSFGGLNKHCKEVYLNTKGMTKETFLYGYAPLSVIKDSIERFSARIRWRNSHRRRIIPFSEQREFHAVGEGVVCYNRRDVMDWAIEEKEEKVIRGICYAAAGEERLDILDEVWNNINDEDNKEDIFDDLDECAAEGGKLNVLKWIETKRLSISKYVCAERAAQFGHLNILKWLQEEKGLELDGWLYVKAIRGGNHLHVIKWLREQVCPWDERTFYSAAEKGNLDILQWLHNEGCPWPEDHLIYANALKPEVVQWCRVNGYGDRIV